MAPTNAARLLPGMLRLVRVLELGHQYSPALRSLALATIRVLQWPCQLCAHREGGIFTPDFGKASSIAGSSTRETKDFAQDSDWNAVSNAYFFGRPKFTAVSAVPKSRAATAA
jgi:hypothetical protein